jgi:hypothetical protein
VFDRQSNGEVTAFPGSEGASLPVPGHFSGARGGIGAEDFRAHIIIGNSREQQATLLRLFYSKLDQV